MSIGTPAPAVRHAYFGGHRGGGFLFIAFLLVSTGAPGVTLVVPDSKEAQGSTQSPWSFGLPLASLSLRQRWPWWLQSELCLQLRPRPTVRGSRGIFFDGPLSAAARRKMAARRAFIQI